MKCILKDTYGEEQYESVREALDSAVVMWEYKTSVPKHIRKMDGTIIKTEDEIYNYYDKWWEGIYSPKSKSKFKRRN